MRFFEKYVPSSDGIHTLHGVVCVPDGEIRGLVQVVHGMAEYAARYEPFLQLLAENGYVAFAHDHLGHGLTAKDETEYGYIAPRDGWRLLVSDVDVFAKAVMEDYSDLPRILFGHSMGSFIVRLYAQEHSAELAGLIVMGTGGTNPAAGAGIAVAKAIGAVRGKRHKSHLVNALAFGKYNARTENRTMLDWLSVNPENVDWYIENPLCGFSFTVSAMADLIALNKRANEAPAFAVSGKLPIFVLSGTEDPVGDYGKGPEEVADRYRAAGVSDVTLKLYPDTRHELLSDYCGDVVKSDLLDWIQKRV